MPTMKDEDFRKLVRRQTAFFLKELLPRYLEKYFFGKGYFFLKKLLDDLDQDRLLEIMETKRPSRRWIAKAKSILSHCPVRVRPELKAGKSHGVILGEFSLHEEYSSLGGAYYFDETSKKHIVIYQGSFEALGYDSEEELSCDVLETIVHEFVHFFESHFFRSEQELSWREQPVSSLKHKRISFAEARRRDRAFERLKIVKWVVVLLVAALVIWGVVSGL